MPEQNIGQAVQTASEEVKKNEQFFKQTIPVQYPEKDGDTYEFRVPSMFDKTRIASEAAKFRRDSDPNRNGLVYGYDPNAIMFFENLATFTVLLKSTTATWVFTAGDNNSPLMDLTRWSEDAPVEEVVGEFRKKLADFRAARNSR